MSSTLHLPQSVRARLGSWLAQPEPLSPRALRRRACLYKVDRLGDLVLSLGALHELVDHLGAQQCRLVVSDTVAALAAAEFPSVPRWEIPAASSGVWRELRPLRRQVAGEWATETFEDLICLRHATSLHRDVTLTWIHARKWHGLGPRPGRRQLCPDNHPVVPADYPSALQLPWNRELAAHQRLLQSVLGRAVPWTAVQPRLTRFQATRGEAIAFCPYGHEPIRDYPEESWIRVWRAVASQVGTVQLLGAKSQESRLAALAHRLRHEAGLKGIEMAGATPPLEFIRRLAGSRGIVSVDSAAAHLATALDKPAVLVLGGGHFGRFCPWGDSPRQAWLSHPLPCFDCNWQCRHETVRCLTELPPEQVAEALAAMLAHA